jgi:hypothetical protein
LECALTTQEYIAQLVFLWWALFPPLEVRRLEFETTSMPIFLMIFCDRVWLVFKGGEAVFGVFFPDWYPLPSCYRLNNFFRIGILFAVMLPVHAIFADRVWLVFMEVGLAWRVLAFFLDWYPLL